MSEMHMYLFIYKYYRYIEKEKIFKGHLDINRVKTVVFES